MAFGKRSNSVSLKLTPITIAAPSATRVLKFSARSQRNRPSEKIAMPSTA